ncbi:AcrB/AcrD/AcrF family protein [Sphingomonas oleivorans]|uniref:AcrB/AcrD/AcrF family protein n=1 Tax=Sphingomonas oleivorans TaxID=1735121 RepID=UPI001FB012C0|nr:AcrB/AcrD/AcrF family protein [Sphingomonas oleivorans]
MKRLFDDRQATHWRRWLLLCWVAAAIWMLVQRWPGIIWLALPDTDDNVRLAQVRALIAGQGWYDLRQYKLDPPLGANIHWSRLVDLPIAAVMLIVKPFFGGLVAQKAAVAAAPVMVFGAALYALGLAVRRLVAPWAFLLAAAILFCGQNAMNMWMPLRIDHHGWQLATLILMVAGLADPKPFRGGITAGLATAASLAIGLELLPYLALGGAMTALWWVVDRGQADRLRGYGIALGAGSAIGFALFASYDNRQLVCDALSPVYLSATLAGGALLVLLASFRIEARGLRLAAVLAAGALLGLAFALAWPQCLGRPERLTPELERLWFANVREAKPVYQHGWRLTLQIVALPVAGVIGSLVALWRARATDRLMPWAAVTLLCTLSAALLLWQTRAAPAAQLLAVPGATALGWLLLPWLMRRSIPIRLAAAVALFVALSGSVADLVVRAIPAQPASKSRRVINLANRRCPTLPALRPIARMPATTILTFVDFGPRLIAVTHHSAIAGPYHRNQQAILDVQHSFRAKSPEVAHEVMRRHGATLLLLCPGMSESTLYASQNRDGFYMQLQRGQVPGWLEAVPLPEKSPFKLWKRID